MTDEQGGGRYLDSVSGKWKPLLRDGNKLYIGPKRENRRDEVDDGLHQSGFGVMTVKKFKKSTPSARLKDMIQRNIGF